MSTHYSHLLRIRWSVLLIINIIIPYIKLIYIKYLLADSVMCCTIQRPTALGDYFRIWKEIADSILDGRLRQFCPKKWFATRGMVSVFLRRWLHGEGNEEKDLRVIIDLLWSEEESWMRGHTKFHNNLFWSLVAGRRYSTFTYKLLQVHIQVSYGPACRVKGLTTPKK